MTKREVDADRLIAEMEKYPPLYDTTHPLYKNKKHKLILWEEVYEAVYPNWEDYSSDEKCTKGKELQKRWKSLRDCFKREMSLQRQEKLEYGDSGTVKRRQYLYFEQMKFLMPSRKNRKLRVRPAIKTIHNQAYMVDHDYVDIPYKPKKTNHERNLSEDEFDEDRAFFMSLLPTMKKFNDDQKFAARIQIMQVVRQIQSGKIPDTPIPLATVIAVPGDSTNNLAQYARYKTNSKTFRLLPKVTG